MQALETEFRDYDKGHIMTDNTPLTEAQEMTPQEIASLKAELGEAREIIGEFIGPGKFYGEVHGAEGTTPNDL